MLFGSACIRLLTQGACFKKLPAVDPKNDASRYEGSKSSASTKQTSSAHQFSNTRVQPTQTFVASSKAIHHDDIYDY